MTEPSTKCAAIVIDSEEAADLPAPVLSPVLSNAFRSFTPARIGLSRAGISVATTDLLDFQLAHARARDAVQAALQPASLRDALRSVPEVASLREPGVLLLQSAAPNRQVYLQRPDLGRKLSSASSKHLQEIRTSTEPFGLSLVLADGLSALAVERHGVRVLAALLPMLQRAAPSLPVAPVCIVEQGRVAVGDEVANELAAELVVVLIGERPGLSSPDSLGAYITWMGNGSQASSDDRERQRRLLITDADRNCISNIRDEGLGCGEAAERILYYIQEARRRRQTGIALKDPSRAVLALEADEAAGTQAVLPGTQDERDER